jgi:transposase
MILQSCDWLRLSTLGGLSQLLRRLEISYKQARNYIHSPDPYYAEKLSQIELCRLKAWYDPERYVLLYLDELTYYRQPTLAPAYECSGHTQPLAQRSLRANTWFRVIAALNAITGQVTYDQKSKIQVLTVSGFFATLRTAHPDAKEIYVVLDNWPVHFHADALARLQRQVFDFGPPRVPPRWPTQPSSKAVHDDLPIRLLPLPTYASWLNPIEKLWRKLKQEVLHLHRLSDDWPALKQNVASFLDQYRLGSPQLLRYVGLLPD